MFNLTDNIKEFFENLISDVLESALQWLANIVFTHKGLTGFLNETYLLFISFGAGVMLVILLWKILEYTIQTNAGASHQVGLSDILLRAVLASALIPILPFILTFLVRDIITPLGTWMFGEMGKYTAEGVTDYLSKGSIGDIIGDGFVFLIVLGFVTVAIVAFTIKICIYHVDLLVLELLSIWAAISVCSDENNYMSVWWREVLSQLTTIIVQMALMVAITEILTSDSFTWWKFMLLIGMCVLIIRGPSVLRHMWYGTGSSRTMINGGKMATRFAMVRGRTR
ncbi:MULTISPECIES: conjugal transfer protein TrbL family protein [Halobacillus]|uniref:conjugal transfer protein TrbL family protein n=1 Tax=Halobacillus TaxID=45667 RepID=UPI0009A773F5|nr:MULTISPECIES: conjugal transfer protein TrbL family protein [Halobacillus]